MSDYPAFPKIPRLHRGVVITEKIDGSNALVSIERVPFGSSLRRVDSGEPITAVVMETLGETGVPEAEFILKAGSRKRWITLEEDNFGFASWVCNHAAELTKLGSGLHYGEWYGQGIQRGYGLSEKRFALFNSSRWSDPESRPGCCGVVPVLKITNGENLSVAVWQALERLRVCGSAAVPDYMHPEGVVVYHTAARQCYKVLLENDRLPKG